MEKPICRIKKGYLKTRFIRFQVAFNSGKRAQAPLSSPFTIALMKASALSLSRKRADG